MHHPQLAKCFLPRPMTSYPNLWRSVLPRSRDTNQGHNYPSGRCSASPRSLSFYSRHTSRPISLTPKLTHPSSLTQTLLMMWMQQYDKPNESDTMEGPSNRSKRSQTGWVQEIGVSHLMKGKLLRGRKSMLTLSPGSRGREYWQCPHSSNSMVDLNQVLSGMHAISNDNWEVEPIRGIQLKYGAAEAVKKAKNSGDWS